MSAHTSTVSPTTRLMGQRPPSISGHTSSITMAGYESKGGRGDGAVRRRCDVARASPVEARVLAVRLPAVRLPAVRPVEVRLAAGGVAALGVPAPAGRTVTVRVPLAVAVAVT